MLKLKQFKMFYLSLRGKSIQSHRPTRVVQQAFLSPRRPAPVLALIKANEMSILNA